MWRGSSGSVGGGHKRGRSAQRKARSEEGKGYCGGKWGTVAGHPAKEVGAYKDVTGKRSGNKAKQDSCRVFTWAMLGLCVIHWDAALHKGSEEASIDKLVSDSQSRLVSDSARILQIGMTIRLRVGMCRANHNACFVQTYRQHEAHDGAIGGVGCLGRLDRQCDTRRGKCTRCLCSAGGVGIGSLVCQCERLGRPGYRALGKAQGPREWSTMRRKMWCTHHRWFRQEETQEAVPTAETTQQTNI